MLNQRGMSNKRNRKLYLMLLLSIADKRLAKIKLTILWNGHPCLFHTKGNFKLARVLVNLSVLIGVWQRRFQTNQ